MTSNANGYVKIMKVVDFAANEKPVDITDAVTAVKADAIPRILSRLETSDATVVNPRPVFASIARTCTHQRCNILVGGNWGVVDEPITYPTVGTDNSIRATIECPCHGTRFDLISGEVLRGPTSGSATDLAMFATKVEDVDGEPHVFVAIEPQGSDGAGG